jgi:hypothetical protein
LEATVKNTVVVEKHTTMEMTTTDTTISDRSAVERVSKQVEHPVLLSTESQDFDNHTSKNFYAKEIKDWGGGGRYLVAQSFYRGEKTDEELDEKDIKCSMRTSRVKRRRNWVKLVTQCLLGVPEALPKLY